MKKAGVKFPRLTYVHAEKANGWSLFMYGRSYPASSPVTGSQNRDKRGTSVATSDMVCFRFMPTIISLYMYLKGCTRLRTEIRPFAVSEVACYSGLSHGKVPCN